ncbi:transporter substrate-binding domain-containing protein [Terasakiella sp. SH-1]|uniref:substrate-binding periplasmic protein n=1 Tax=Terasakiella sp. SH-1 TaxID=2560057 RepID=UPI00107374DD|nr:transporter substrate-binding domain-containing protein [Terasakiella sp. SH-1]
MRSLFLSCLILCAALLFHSNAKANEAQVVKLYTYHTHPPFIVSDKKGLTYELADFLNQRANGKYKFVVSPSSRPRVNKVITGKSLAIVPWVNPPWFKDKEETKYLWTAEPLLSDGNSILSLKSKAVDYKDAQSLNGMIFGGLHGHRYSGIDDHIAQGGNIRRVDGDNHIDNLEKLINGDIDCMLMPTSSAHYEKAQGDRYKDVFIAPNKHSSFNRRILVINHNQDLKSFLDQALANDRKGWEQHTRLYQ